MNPQQPLQPPIQTPQSDLQPSPQPKKSITLPVVLMVLPAALLILMIISSVVVSMLFPDTPPTDGSLFGQPNPIKTIVNVGLFIGGAGAVVLGPPMFIVGLVLLIQRKSKTHA